MSIVQFLRIFWARRILIVSACISCFVGAIIICMILPPVWEAKSRVVLDVIKPDPVTGEVYGVAGRMYIASQAELITDYSVAGKVPEKLGMLSDPNLIERYNKRSKSDTRDFNHWATQLIVDSTKAAIVQDTNVLEITYDGSSPESAKGVADALTEAYIETSLAFKRDAARRSAEYFSGEALKAKTALDEAIKAETDFERENGLVMANEKTDVETARLQALAGQPGVQPPVFVPAAPASTSSSLELAQTDGQIAALARDVGPNNPQLQELKARRASLAALVAQDRAAQDKTNALASGTSATVARILGRAVDQQKSRVVAESDKIGKLSQLQAQVDLRRAEFQKTSENEAMYRMQALTTESGVSPLSSATVGKSPKFPNLLLILPGSIALGAGLGVLTALLLEFFGQRVRGVEDLNKNMDVPLLAAIEGPPKPSRRRRWAGLRFGARVPA